MSTSDHTTYSDAYLAELIMPLHVALKQVLELKPVLIKSRNNLKDMQLNMDDLTQRLKRQNEMIALALAEVTKLSTQMSTSITKLTQ